jgi:outer membrane receptor protein involved in Fe transport
MNYAKIALLVCASPVAMASQAAAQEIATDAASSSQVAAESEALASDEIIVTAQRREQSLNDVPISVNVVGGQTLAENNITNLEDLSATLPAVKISQTPTSDQLYIRGTGSGFNGGFEQSVATFVDGVYRGRSRSSRTALFDIERIEVLRGPQTTYFGNNAIAGAFNITTRKPGASFGYNASALYSPSDGEYNLEAGLNLPISDQLSVRIAGQFYGMDGYVRNSFLREDAPHMRDAIGRAVAVWKPTASFTSTLRIDVGRNRDRGTAPIELENCPPDPVFGGARGQCAAYLAEAGGSVDDTLDFKTAIGESAFRNDMLEMAFSNEFDIGGHVLSSTTSYFDQHSLAFTNIIPVPRPGVFGAPSPFPAAQDERYDQFTQELRLSSDTGRALEYMVGVYYLRGKLDHDNFFGFYFAPFSNLPPSVAAGFPANTALAVPSTTRQTENTISAFGSLTYSVTEALRVSAGLRYTSVRKEADRVIQAGSTVGGRYDAPFTPASPAAQNAILRLVGQTPGPFPISSRKDDDFMPSAVVQYDLTDQVMAYAAYTNGFKAGGFSTLTSDTFGPESVDAYEVGLKGALLDRMLSFNVAAFLSNYSNLQEATQVLLPSGSFVAVIGNSARSRSKGIELSTTLRLADWIRIHSDVAYLDARYVDFQNAPCTALAAMTPGCTQDLSGKKRAYSPEWSGGARVEIRLPLQNVEVQIDPAVSFSSSHFQQNVNDPFLRQPGYAKYDLRVAIGEPSGRWTLSVIGKNLSNKATASYRNFIPTSPGSNQALPDRARSIAVQFAINM